MEIGIDIEKNERFKNMDEKHLEKIFTKNEILYAKKYTNFENHLCAFWCAKEAFFKAISNATIAFTEIQVSHDKNSKPFIVKTEKIEKLLNEHGVSEIKISLSHSLDYSTAVCLLY